VPNILFPKRQDIPGTFLRLRPFIIALISSVVVKEYGKRSLTSISTLLLDKMLCVRVWQTVPTPTIKQSG